ncbi:MAG: DinB family protein [Thermomicrobiales bacterium]
MTATTVQATQERMRQRERVGEKARVLRDIDKAWRAFMDSSTFIPESLMDEPGVSGQWSIKDILAHVAAWDRETTRVVMEILRGDAPTWPIHEQMFTDLNREADRHLTVNEARNRALSAHKALVEMLDGKAEVRAEWGRRPTYAPHPEHTAEIVRWRTAHPLVPDLTRARSSGAAGEVDTPDPESGQEHVPTPELSPSLRPPLR